MPTSDQTDHIPSPRRTWLLGMLLIPVGLGPYVVGLIDDAWAMLYFALLGLLALTNMLWKGPLIRVRRPLALAVLASCLTLTIAEVVLRPLLREGLYYRPHEMFICPWPRMPMISRYAPNVHYEGRSYGDLAAIAGLMQYRQERRTRFVTDRFGFRNEQSDPNDIDILLLGDSFGAAIGVSQEKTWGHLLSERHGQTVYNLSIPGSPWDEYVNFTMESSRLKTKDDALLVWAIFTGNDLDEGYHSLLHVDQLPWHGWLGVAKVRFREYRRRSCIRTMIRQAMEEEAAPEKVLVRDFIDGSKVLFYKLYADNAQLSLDEVRQAPNRAHLNRTLAAMKTAATRKRLRVAVILLPSKAEVYSWALHGSEPWSADPAPSSFSIVLRAMCEVQGLHFLDLKPLLIRQSRVVYEADGDLLWWRDDSHWNGRGHEVVAEIVYRRLIAPNDH